MAKALPWYFLNISSLASFLAVFICGESLGKKGDGQFKFNIDPRDIFFDNKIVPHGKEMKTYLQQGKMQRYFYVVREGGAPMTLDVHPCVSDLHVLIHFQKEKTDKRSSFARRALSTQVNFDSTVFNTTSYNTITFKTLNADAGLYILDITSISSDSYVRLFGSPGLRNKETLDMILPHDKRIHIIQRRMRIILNWKPVRRKTSRVIYCVAINRKRNFSTMCGFIAYSRGDERPKRPQNSGFGFSWEDADFKRFRENANPVKAAKPHNYILDCLGNRTTYVLNLDKHRRTFYLDVYVVHKTSNISSAYDGGRVTFPRSKRQKRTLFSNKARYLAIAGGRRAVRLSYDLNNSTDVLEFSVVSCGIALRMTIFKQGRFLASKRAKRPNTVTLRLPEQGRYVVKISFPKTQSKRYFTVMVSTKPNTFGLPVLPTNINLHVFEKSLRCHSLTVAWMTTSVRQKYCLYQEQTPITYPYSTSERCVNKRKLKFKRKIACKYYRYRRRSQAVIGRKLYNLKYNTTYIYSLYVTRSKVTFPLGTVKIKTKATC